MTTKETLNTINKATHFCFVKITNSKGVEFIRTNKAFQQKATKAQAKKAASCEIATMFKNRLDTLVSVEYGFMLSSGREVVLSWNDLTEIKTTYINPFKVKTVTVHKLNNLQASKSF